MPYPRDILLGGEKVWEVLPPPPRKTITRGRLGVCMRDSSNVTVGEIRCPQCIGITGSGEIR